jgi:hypothetical protein
MCGSGSNEVSGDFFSGVKNFFKQTDNELQVHNLD